MTHFTYLPSDSFHDFFKSSNFSFLYRHADGMGLWFHNSSDCFFSEIFILISRLTFTVIFTNFIFDMMLKFTRIYKRK